MDLTDQGLAECFQRILADEEVEEVFREFLVPGPVEEQGVCAEGADSEARDEVYNHLSN